MAKQGRAPKHALSVEGIHLKGTSDVLAMYSDVFVVVYEGETALASLYFYQRQLDDKSAVLGKTETGVSPSQAKCIARILMSQAGIEKLLEAVAENRGFILTRKNQEQQ